MAPQPTPQRGVRRRKCLPFLSCKRVSICCAIVLVPLLLVFVLLGILPAHIAVSHDAEYFRTLESYDGWNSNLPPELLDDPLWQREVPWNERQVTPLIKDLTQLSTSTWLRQMDFYDDWTAEYPMQEAWIYIGGSPKSEKNNRAAEEKAIPKTPPQQKSIFDDDDDDDYDGEGWLSWIFQGVKKLILNSDFLRRIFGSLMSLPGPSCVDPADICHSFNKGFDRLIELYHTHRENQTAHTALTFVDCDVSPYLCDEWSVDPVLLAHMQTSSLCKLELDPFRYRCSVKWRFVALPLQKMPFQRTVRLSDLVSASSSIAPIVNQAAGSGEKSPKTFDPVVPVFPSAFEQLHSMVSYSGSVEALEFQEHEIIDIKVDPVVK